MTTEQLLVIMPNCVHPEYLPYLVAAMKESQVNTPARQAAFLAQIAHESAELRYMEEIGDDSYFREQYEGRVDLGNIQKDDGPRFKGRGPIQLTGRSNYGNYGKLLGLDLINTPAMAATPEVGFRIAGLFWQRHGLNELADAGAFEKITRLINGGINGLAARKAYWEKAKRVLNNWQ